MAVTGQADIALDPFPYSGGQTTLETLWMGVPLVTCPGDTFASRHAAGYLSVAGLGDLVARDVDGYVEAAARLASDLERLAGLRATLRQRLSTSPLCDVTRFADHLDRALRRIWRDHCRGLPPRSFAVPAVNKNL